MRNGLATLVAATTTAVASQLGGCSNPLYSESSPVPIYTTNTADPRATSFSDKDLNLNYKVSDVGKGDWLFLEELSVLTNTLIKGNGTVLEPHEYMPFVAIPHKQSRLSLDSRKHKGRFSMVDDPTTALDEDETVLYFQSIGKARIGTNQGFSIRESPDGKREAYLSVPQFEALTETFKLKTGEDYVVGHAVMNYDMKDRVVLVPNPIIDLNMFTQTVEIVGKAFVERELGKVKTRDPPPVPATEPETSPGHVRGTLLKILDGTSDKDTPTEGENTPPEVPKDPSGN